MKLFLLFGFLLLLPLASAYNINTTHAYIDTSKAFISASPHTIIGDGYVNLEVMSKINTLDVTMLFGYNGHYLAPEGLEYYNPHTVSVQKSYTCPDAFNYTMNPKYFWCYYQVNGSISFEHEFETGNITTKTGYWTENETSDWKKVTLPYTKISYNYDGKDTWYLMPNIPLQQGIRYQARIKISAPHLPLQASYPASFEKIYPGYDGKYDIAFYPSSYGNNIQEAIQDGVFYLLDPQVNLTGGLASYYSFDSYSGTTVIDSNGVKNGTINVPPDNQYNNTFKKLGNQSLYFSSNVGSNMNLTAYSLPANGTICLWYYRDNTSDHQFVATNNTANGIDLQIAVTNRVYMRVDPDSFISRTGVPNSAWVHLCFTWDSTWKRMWINGTNVNSTSTATIPNPQPRTIFFGKTGASTFRFHGFMDEIGIWNRSLNASEIAALYNGSNTNGPLGYPFATGQLIQSANFTVSSDTLILFANSTSTFGENVTTWYYEIFKDSVSMDRKETAVNQLSGVYTQFANYTINASGEYYVSITSWNGEYNSSPLSSSKQNVSIKPNAIISTSYLPIVDDRNMTFNVTITDPNNSTIYNITLFFHRNNTNLFNLSTTNVANNSVVSFLILEGNYSTNDQLNLTVRANDGIESNDNSTGNISVQQSPPRINSFTYSTPTVGSLVTLEFNCTTTGPSINFTILQVTDPNTVTSNASATTAGGNFFQRNYTPSIAGSYEVVAYCNNSVGNMTLYSENFTATVSNNGGGGGGGGGGSTTTIIQQLSNESYKFETIFVDQGLGVLSFNERPKIFTATVSLNKKTTSCTAETPLTCTIVNDGTAVNISYTETDHSFFLKKVKGTVKATSTTNEVASVAVTFNILNFGYTWFDDATSWQPPNFFEAFPYLVRVTNGEYNGLRVFGIFCTFFIIGLVIYLINKE